MAELKTVKNNQSVDLFLGSVEDLEKRKDCYTILELMGRITGEKPAMWGDSIVGFGDIHYKYASGAQGDWMLTAFSPRKQNLTLYLMSGFPPLEDILSRLGKFKTGKGCLYIKRLSDVNLDVLEELIQKSVELVKQVNFSN